MKLFQKAVTWYRLLTKRFLKKIIFVLLLVVLPLLSWGLRSAASHDSGIVEVLLYQENTEDETSRQIVADLKDLGGVVQYTRAGDLDKAIESVEKGEADCLWVFPDDLYHHLENYVSGKEEGLFKIYVRKDNIRTKIVREQLFACAYPAMAKALTEYMLIQTGDFSEYSDEEIKARAEEFYREDLVEGSLVRFLYPDHSEASEAEETYSYIIAPIRGILSLFLLLCGMTVALFYLQDQRDRLFPWMHIKNRKLFEYLYILTGVIPGAVSAYVALYASGTFTVWTRELSLMILYVFCITGFSTILSRLLHSVRQLSSVIPLLMLLSLIICPVFFNLNLLPVVQHLHPAWYYLNALHSSKILLKMIIFAIASAAIGIIVADDGKV